MRGHVAIDCRLSAHAQALADAFAASLDHVTGDDLNEAIEEFGDALVAYVEWNRAPAAFSSEGLRFVLTIEYPPYLELAMRAVMDAANSPGLQARKVARVCEMTSFLLGG